MAEGSGTSVLAAHTGTSEVKVDDSDLMSCATEAEGSSLPIFDIKPYYPEHSVCQPILVQSARGFSEPLKGSQRFSDLLKASQTLSEFPKAPQSLSEVPIASQSLSEFLRAFQRVSEVLKAS